MTFAQFITQYDAQPPEKLDGYFPFHFEGMSADELEKARTMLLRRALGGDTIDLDGLRHVGDARVVRELIGAKQLASQLGPRYDTVRLDTLFALTQDPAFLADLFIWLDNGAPDDRKFAAEALARHALPQSFEPAVIERLTDGHHEMIAIPLVKAWLSTQGQPISNMTEFQRHLATIRAIVAMQPPERRAALTTA